MKTLATLILAILLSSTVGAQSNSSTNPNPQKTHAVPNQQNSDSLEQLAIAVQKICPVSGAELGFKGKPVKVKVGEQIAYLCCQDCQRKQIDAQHWKTIQSRFAAAQQTCPIMGQPVDSSMKMTVVQGHPVFVCCPPCIEKIQAAPDKTIQKVFESYAKSIQSENSAIQDRRHVQAQRICPVSGNELGSKGEPVKVKVGDSEHAFLCCQECVGQKINPAHWQSVMDNLAAAQGVCPVMGKPVEASMSSTTVQGRRIFVCCPPCIEKIQKSPEAYIKKLTEQIASGYDAKRKSETPGNSGQ